MTVRAGHFLPGPAEITTFEHNCTAPPCVITQLHCPTAGPQGWDLAVVKIYVDGEATPSLSFTLLELANIGRWGHGAGPAPDRLTISPQKNWSPKKGHTSVGLPKRSPAAVVPAPPWCTTAATCGSSQSCGHGPTSKQRGWPPTVIRDQFDCTSTRQPASSAACRCERKV